MMRSWESLRICRRDSDAREAHFDAGNLCHRADRQMTTGEGREVPEAAGAWGNLAESSSLEASPDASSGVRGC